MHICRTILHPYLSSFDPNGHEPDKRRICVYSKSVSPHNAFTVKLFLTRLRLHRNSFSETECRLARKNDVFEKGVYLVLECCFYLLNSLVILTNSNTYIYELSDDEGSHNTNALRNSWHEHENTCGGYPRLSVN